MTIRMNGIENRNQNESTNEIIINDDYNEITIKWN